MNVSITTTLISLAFAVIANPIHADAGKVLYDKSCTKCHTTEVFTRDDRGVKSLGGLKNRVKQCSVAADSKWSDDEIKVVVDYLNKDFYKF